MESLLNHQADEMSDNAGVPEKTISQTAAGLSIASAVLFLILLIALHFIKPEVDPSWRMISEYEIGDFGWVMTLAFLSLSFSYLAIFIAIRSQVKTTAGRIGLALLLLGVVGSAMGGIFITDPITATKDQLTTHGMLHGIGALLGIPTLPFAATLINCVLARNQAWASARKRLFLSAAVTWIGLITFAVSMAVMMPRGYGKFTPEVLIGWSNRFLIVTYAAWQIIVAWRAIKLTTEKQLTQNSSR